MDIFGTQKKAAPTGAGTIGGVEWGAKPNPGTPAGAPAATASSPAASGASAGGQTKDGYWTAREQRDLEKERVYREEDIPAIRRSTAYNVAGGLVAAAIEADALSFGNTAKGKRLDMILGFMDQVAEHVYARINGIDIADDAINAAEAAEEPAEQEEADLG